MMNFAVSTEDDFSESQPAHESIGALERWLAFGLLGCALVLRFLYIWHYRIDSDEPQHLHVVWAWTQGLLPYHDVFDNHSPLFQALFAPLFYLLGVRADILLPMRAGELPLFILAIFCVWKIARSIFTPRVALWTATLAALVPPFYLNSIEFRPDQLWTVVWLLILLVLGTGPIGARRMALAGLLCGLAFCVSMKSSLLLAALVQALIGALIVRWIAGGFPLRWSHIFRCSGAWLAGLVIVPALVVLFFYERGVLRDMYYCVIQHNILPGASNRVFGSAAIKTWLKGLVGALIAGALIVRLRMPIPVRTRIAFLFFAPFLYYTTLEAAWPVLTAEDYLPFYPAMMITIGPAVLWLANRLVRHTFPVGGVLAVAELVCILVTVSPFQDHTVDKIGIVADTLKLTDPSDYVMDSKGETIYRRRPFRYVIESLTFHRIKQGIVKDTIADELIAKRVPLATTQRMPHRARDFIKKNYVPIAFRLYVLGKVLRDKGVTPGAPCAFEIKVPARYTLVDPDGTPAGQLDGTPFTGSRELTAGKHSFLPEGDPGKVVLIWAPAIERGYSPFAKIKKDYKSPQD
ncbi:4-amino-4-deoxy-L-arabinose transferase and related glycosyltransferase of PMT family-like protein [Chthoniobacter flavus Ellin428]|uniref:4-amino-4-deoxy-L-arabinose transferase and related glycosyltransferase of PMT family-like protein n=1 Tax=Chthoniobacter flavus Ellin428 TaxID=497964 RepID=B4D252_9BACT|nr:glycosyltransferase family 39 protein [Chthoniobacter flavus]EDY19292.1 4-amino-4-deoxy-L-arabinose transferase and related glycosyltransferase of PMT family-like protein [Chthoniobacter flavus Ellin428]TCO90575.1 dolichyl-phosphate-mannose-protein mannosyltransferase [Chthoniobacter flavus]